MPGHFTFYSNKIQGSVAWFDETEFKHAIQVLRYQLGDEVSFTDGIGTLYQGKINFISKREFTVEIFASKGVKPLPPVVLGLGVLKSTDRMEWAVEKCTELGIGEVWFLKTKNAERSHLNLERMQKVAISAMKQSHGAYLPAIKACDFEEAVRESGRFEGKKYIAYCGDSQVLPISACELPCVYFIGPEGDFTDGEYQFSVSEGFVGMGLGSTILRTETAAVAALAALRLK